MKLRRGFKTEANELALEVRAELDLPPHSPLCPFELAKHLCIPVHTLSGLAQLDPSSASSVQALLSRHRSLFSAITIFDGHKRCIVHNDRHAPVRRRSNVAHELAHALLHHPPHTLLCSTGARAYESEIEAEANWFGPVLLVPNEAARWAMLRAMDVASAAQHFDVSEELMQFRFRMSGAVQILRRSGAARAA
jgi:uncharacterized protein DUF955